ncbi:hypothetical protein TNCV_4047291 [Trichonephila clavipes]|nr:hypothetical protein TNCV_4047291 [Trichonephila clavipes]
MCHSVIYFAPAQHHCKRCLLCRDVHEIFFKGYYENWPLVTSPRVLVLVDLRIKGALHVLQNGCRSGLRGLHLLKVDALIQASCRHLVPSASFKLSTFLICNYFFSQTVHSGRV